MTPPHPATDRTQPIDLAGLGPSETSAVQEMERFALDVHKRSAALFARMEARLESFESRVSKSEETSDAMIRLPRKVAVWRVLALVVGALGLGGTGGSYMGARTIASRVEERQGLSEEAAAQAAAEARAAAVVLAAPRQQPADVGRLADTLDRLDRRLSSLEDRLERIEQRRGR